MALVQAPGIENLLQHVPLWKALSLPTAVVASCAGQSVGILRLSVRPSNCLTKTNIANLGQLVSLSVTEMFAIPAMGYGSVQEIVRRVTKFFNEQVADLSFEFCQDSKRVSLYSHDNVERAPLTLRDEWEVFAYGVSANLPVILLALRADFIAQLSLPSDATIDMLLDWSWDGLRECLGEDSADELLHALVTVAQMYRAVPPHAFPCDFDERQRWLEARWAHCPLKKCGLQEQTLRLLQAKDIRTFRQIIEALNPLTKAVAYDLPAFIDIWERLVALDLRQGDAQAEWELLIAMPECVACLDDVVADLKVACGERTWQILDLRFGMEMLGEEAESSPEKARERRTYTLEEVGHRVSATRERARQIEARGIEKLQELKAASWQSLAATLERLVQQAGGVLSLGDAANEISFRFPADTVHPEGICHLLFEISGLFAPVQRGAIYRLMSVPANAYAMIIDQAAKIARTSLVNLSEEELGYKAQERLCAEGHSFEISLIDACLRADGRFASTMIRRDLNFQILEILRSIGKPAHYTEITERLNATGWRRYPTSEKSLHSRLVDKRDLFVYVEPGVYGLVEWGLEDKRVFDRNRNGFIGDIVEEFLAERDAPANATEIIAYVLSRKRCQDYSVRMCLSREERFYAFGTGKYGLKRWVM